MGAVIVRTLPASGSVARNIVGVDLPWDSRENRRTCKARNIVDRRYRYGKVRVMVSTPPLNVPPLSFTVTVTTAVPF